MCDSIFSYTGPPPGGPGLNLTLIVMSLGPGTKLVVMYLGPGTKFGVISLGGDEK